MERKRIVVGLSGATGLYPGLRLITVLNDNENYTAHVVNSGGFAKVFEHERRSDRFISKICTKWGFHEVDGNLWIDKNARKYGSSEHSPCNSVLYGRTQMAAPIASGSFETDGMVILPCSMNTLSSIAHGRADSLLTRAADVTLKESRKLVLCVRETPLSKIHLENMVRASNAGATIMPVMLPTYSKQLTAQIYTLMDKFVGRVLMQFGITSEHLHVWKGE